MNVVSYEISPTRLNDWIYHKHLTLGFLLFLFHVQRNGKSKAPFYYNGALQAWMFSRTIILSRDVITETNKTHVPRVWRAPAYCLLQLSLPGNGLHNAEYRCVWINPREKFAQKQQPTLGHSSYGTKPFFPYAEYSQSREFAYWWLWNYFNIARPRGKNFVFFYSQPMVSGISNTWHQVTVTCSEEVTSWKYFHF